jgi:putative ABC transport system permease protein
LFLISYKDILFNVYGKAGNLYQAKKDSVWVEEALTSYPLTIESESIDMSTVMTEQMEKTNKDLEDAKKNKNKVYSNNTIGDMLSIMSSKVQSNNLEKFKNFIENEKN